MLQNKYRWILQCDAKKRAKTFDASANQLNEHRLDDWTFKCFPHSKDTRFWIHGGDLHIVFVSVERLPMTLFSPEVAPNCVEFCQSAHCLDQSDAKHRTGLRSLIISPRWPLMPMSLGGHRALLMKPF